MIGCSTTNVVQSVQRYCKAVNRAAFNRLPNHLPRTLSDNKHDFYPFKRHILSPMHIDIDQLDNVIKRKMAELIEEIGTVMRHGIQIPDIRIDELDMSVRSHNCLKNAKIETVADLMKFTERDLLKTQNFGRKSLNEIKDVLEDLNIRWPIIQQ
jgi:hypothetical protein